MSSREFCLMLLKEHYLLVVPGTAFGDSGEWYIRISYATSMEKLKALIETLTQLLAKY